MSILISQLNKHFGAFNALKDINLDIPEGELVALLGPSGCGKTTLLRIIAGLEWPDSGRIAINGEDKTQAHASNRGIGFVFQHYALFRHMTVFDNIAFGLRIKPRRQRPSESIIHKKVHALLNLVQLDWLHDRFPDQLSGGQRQRIALARALAVEPSVLLLDEPFGALDASVRKDLRQWLRNLHRELHVTSIFVTHDQEEAMEVASRIVVLNKGKVEQQGSPSELYDLPANAFVSQFIGQTNVLDGYNHRHWLDSIGLGDDARPGLVAHVRPQHIAIEKAKTEFPPAAVLKDWQHLGATTRVELAGTQTADASDPILQVEMPSEHFKQLQLLKGDAVDISIKHVQWFNQNLAGSASGLTSTA